MYVFVHGFGHDAAEGRSAAVKPYPLWRKMLGVDELDVYEHLWYSAPFSVKNVLEAWAHGRLGIYRYAWDLAYEEGEVLASELKTIGLPVDIVCHSLGSRVVLRALELGAPARKVLILNGAEYRDTAVRIAWLRRDVEFYAVVVEEDDVLSKFGRVAPGSGNDFVGNTSFHAPNWTSLPIDTKYFQKKWPGVAGDNPSRIADHWYSFENEDNWPLYRAIFDDTYET